MGWRRCGSSCTGTASSRGASSGTSSRSRGRGRLLVAPEGLSRFYVREMSEPVADRKVGASWMTREDRLQGIPDYVRYLDAVDAAVWGGVARSRPPGTVRGFLQGPPTPCRRRAQAPGG